MLNAEQRKTFETLRVEIIDLAIVSHFFVRKINRHAYLWRETTRHFILEEYTALRYMENGIILHLTKLDDEKAKFSFHAAAKVINNTEKDAKKTKKLNEAVTEYRQTVNHPKTQHRNTRIAHMNQLEDLDIGQSSTLIR